MALSAERDPSQPERQEYYLYTHLRKHSLNRSMRNRYAYADFLHPLGLDPASIAQAELHVSSAHTSAAFNKEVPFVSPNRLIYAPSV